MGVWGSDPPGSNEHPPVVVAATSVRVGHGVGTTGASIHGTAWTPPPSPGPKSLDIAGQRGTRGVRHGEGAPKWFAGAAEVVGEGAAQAGLQLEAEEGHSLCDVLEMLEAVDDVPGAGQLGPRGCQPAPKNAAAVNPPPSRRSNWLRGWDHFCWAGKC